VKGGEREGIDEGRKNRGEERSAKERAMYSKERQRENRRAR
jgi:hypothetical protein